MLLCGNRIAVSDILSDSAVSPDFDIKACKFTITPDRSNKQFYNDLTSF